MLCLFRLLLFVRSPPLKLVSALMMVSALVVVVAFGLVLALGLGLLLGVSPTLGCWLWLRLLMML